DNEHELAISLTLSGRRGPNTNNSTQDSRHHSLHSYSQMGDDRTNNLSHVIVRGNATALRRRFKLVRIVSLVTNRFLLVELTRGPHRTICSWPRSAVARR